MSKPSEAEIIKALEAAERSLGDAMSMSVTDEIPHLYPDNKMVKDVLKRLRGY